MKIIRPTTRCLTPDPKLFELPAESRYPTLRVRNIVKFGLLDRIFHVLSCLYDPPDRPHCVRRGAPRPHLLLEVRHHSHELELGHGPQVGGDGRVLEVREVKVGALLLGRVPRVVENVRRVRVVVCRPLVEVVRNIERSRVR